MTRLIDQLCTPCSTNALPLSPDELSAALRELPDWEKTAGEIPKLQRRYPFKNFIAALKFANSVGELAEEFNHHPTLIIEWGKVTVQWWSHKIDNIHQTDAILAAKTDAKYRAETA
jgi:4a-hydroxytetrahydrobiopterin dehydratase